MRERCPSHPTKHSLRLKSPTRNSSVSPPRNEPRKLSPDDEAFFSFLPLAQFRTGSQVGTRILGGTIVMGTRTARRRVSPAERRQLSQEGSHLRQTSHPSTYRRLVSKVAVQNSLTRGFVNCATQDQSNLDFRPADGRCPCIAAAAPSTYACFIFPCTTASFITLRFACMGATW